MFIVPCAFIFIIFHQTNHKNHKGNYSYSIILNYNSVIQESHREIQSKQPVENKLIYSKKQKYEITYKSNLHFLKWAESVPLFCAMTYSESLLLLIKIIQLTKSWNLQI